MKEIVLLTGFAGFIGSQLSRDLVSKGYLVIGVDNLSEGSDVSNFKDCNHLRTPLFHKVFADIADPNLLKYLEAKISRIDYVISNAAQSHVDRSWDQYDTFVRTNISGQVNLANIALKYNVKKFVYVNTDEVFAGSPQPFTEETLFSPENIYSSTKAAADMLLMNYYKAHKLPLVITHGANTYGPRQKEKIIPLAIECILNHRKIQLYQTPARRMWLHVKDHSSGIIAAMEKGYVGERYCLAPSEKNELYTHELVEHISRIFGKELDQTVTYVPDRLNYDLRYYMLNTKAKKDLDWKPKKNILTELEKIVRWYSDYFNVF